MSIVYDRASGADSQETLRREWFEANGLGGCASSTHSGAHSRLACTAPGETGSVSVPAPRTRGAKPGGESRGAAAWGEQGGKRPGVHITCRRTVDLPKRRRIPAW